MMNTDNSANGRPTVMVVGAGIIGLASAHYLTEAGYQVTVIDKGTIGGECSHANCGYICPSHVPPMTEPGAFKVAFKSLGNPKSPFRWKPRFDPALWKWMYQFAIRCNHQQVLTAGASLQKILDLSIAEYRQLMQKHQFDCEWKEEGLLYVFRSKQAFQEFSELDRMLTEHFGVSANPISGKELPDFDPSLRSDLQGAYHYLCDASVRPDLLNRSWTDYLKGQGVQFREHCQCLNLNQEGGRLVSITTDQGILQADHFVLAMGAISSRWSKQLNTPVPVQPGKGYSVTLERPELCPNYPMLFLEAKVGVSPFQSGMRLGSMMEFAGYDTTIPPARIQQLRDSARQYLKTSVDGPAQESWYGWRPMTWDSLPIIGPVPNLKNATLACGHNMIGLTLAPATGKLVAELVSGRPPSIDLQPYSPLRFR